MPLQGFHLKVGAHFDLRDLLAVGSVLDCPETSDFGQGNPLQTSITESSTWSKSPCGVFGQVAIGSAQQPQANRV